MSELDKHRSQFSSDSSSTAGAFSESESIHLGGTLAQGRTGQSPHKNWLMLAFAKRVIDGDAKPHETAFMAALMAADIPEETTYDASCAVFNTISLIDCINRMQNEPLVDPAAHLKGGE